MAQVTTGRRLTWVMSIRHGSGAQIHNSLTSTTTPFLPKTVGEHCIEDAIKMEALDQSSLGLLLA